jgi:peptide/nickel transport system permease protein
MQIGGILAGAVITETVFSRQGLGRVLQNGVLSQDIPLVQGVVVLSAVLFVLTSFLVDLLYPLLDPRIRKA